MTGIASNNAPIQLMGVTGPALPSDAQAKTQIRNDGGAKCGVADVELDHELLIERWAELPEPIRAGIVAIVQTMSASGA